MVHGGVLGREGGLAGGMKPTRKFVRRTPLVFVMVFVFALSFPRPEAQAGDGLSGLVSGIYYSVGLTAVATVTSAIGNTVYLARGTRAPTGWGWAGYITGGVTAAAGFGFALVLTVYDEAEIGLGVGLPILACGVGTILVAAFASADPEPGLKLSMAPIVIPDTEGQLAPGVGVSLWDF